MTVDGLSGGLIHLASDNGVKTGSVHDDLARLLIEVGNTAGRSSQEGEAMLRKAWPHSATARTARSISPSQMLGVFKADGFRCRYTGDLLLFPPYLRALSAIWPEAFPYHPHWKSEVTHEAYWTHTASLEHVEPVAIGGAEAEDNWITTSGARNQVRSRYSLEALRWKVGPRCPLPDWDGGLRAFIDLLEVHPALLEGPDGAHFKKWQKLAGELG
jgi:hypothetical protein